jgi:hypothetical protein
MGIEIRQLVVNASIAYHGADTGAMEEKTFDPEAFRVELLAACRDLIRQLNERDKER